MKRIIFAVVILILSYNLFSQQTNYTQTFEESKNEGSNFDSLKVKVGGDFALQFQSLKSEADSAMVPLGNGINLPTANFVIDAFLAKGIKVKLETYLSARHHNEAWVKGGYLLINSMPFFESQTIENIMQYLTIKVGVMDLDYGDAHYRRTDNGNAIRNPFVGNYIMDAYTTASAMEFMFRKNGLIAMIATSNAVVNQQIVGYNSAKKEYLPYRIGDELAYYGKLGYDKQISDDFRLRTTISGFVQEKTHSGTLWSGDRAGSRYYLVMMRPTKNAADVDIKANYLTGNWGPGSTYRNYTFGANLFAKYKGFELFVTFDYVNGLNSSKTTKFKYQQIAVEGIMRFGKHEQYYGGVRYNVVGNHQELTAANSNPTDDQSISRIQIAGGWNLNKYIIAKVEYVNQQYKKFDKLYGAKAGFNGLMIEAAISF